MSVRPAKNKKSRPERLVARLRIDRTFARVVPEVLLDEALVVAEVVELHHAPCEAHGGLRSVAPELGPAFASDLRALEERARELLRRKPPRLPKVTMWAVQDHVLEVVRAIVGELPSLTGPDAEALRSSLEGFIARHADARVCHEVHDALLALASVLDVYVRVSREPAKAIELRAESYRFFVIVDEVVARLTAWTSVNAVVPGALTQTLVVIERMIALVRDASGAVLWCRAPEAYAAVMGSALRASDTRRPRAEDSSPRLASVDSLRPVLSLPKAS